MNTNTPILTDLYQLTMAAGYWHAGLAEKEAVFHLTYRKQPFAGGYAIAAGLADVIQWLEHFRFSHAEIQYLATLPGRDGKPIFDPAFLNYLKTLKWQCDVDAIPEGTAVFPHEPLIRVKGPLIQAQLIETAVLNIVNFQTLIATKAARVCGATKNDLVMEFGLRRAQGPNGGMAATRAAYIGGCGATSNVLGGMQLGIPVKGTHAHSWVMAFHDEITAFEAYSKALPNNCIFLVDTYDTIEGVKNAVIAGQKLRERGHELAGIRLDSGDLAWLSQEARKILDAGGFPDAVIVASNDLDEHLIESLKQQGATITVWGVGTQLVTGGDQAALGGVYKLGAIKDDQGKWLPKIKLSEHSAKVSNPGIQQVRRFKSNGVFIGDAIFDEDHQPEDQWHIIDPNDPIRNKRIAPETEYEDLLTPVYREGKLVYNQPHIQDIQRRTKQQLAALHPTIKRLQNPHTYPAGLDQTLAIKKAQMIKENTPKHA